MEHLSLASRPSTAGLSGSARQPGLPSCARLLRLLALGGLLGAAGAAGAGPAFADVELEAKGAVAFLHSDRLQPGDDASFARFIEAPRSVPIRIVYLDSRGGATRAAIAIGREIRARGLATAFHVGRGRCVSACTTMFLGGVRRYYIDGDGVPDGVATHLGLGFHPNTGGARGEEFIQDYYREMGVEGANAFRYKIYSRDAMMAASGGGAEGGEPYRMFFAGGRSALAAGVATSTAEPDDARLRD